MNIFSTRRLRVRRLTLDDALFILDLVNEPGWLAYIGDRGVRTLDDAGAYLTDGPLAMYARVGFGLFAVELTETRACIGMCGLLQRDTLAHPDLGFAFLEAYQGNGYAAEAAGATLTYGHDVLGLDPILAIAQENNQRSLKLLERLGFALDRVDSTKPDAPALRIYVHRAADAYGSSAIR